MMRFKELKKKGARLSTITAVDKKTLIYHFFVNGKFKNIKVKIKNNRIESICSIFPNAEFYEREIFETFGIKFEGNPNLKRLFLTEDVKNPLRK
jgi:NADH-quinone oxidoreductase subunit C/D